MKTLFTLLLLIASLICFGQKKSKKKFDNVEKSITTASSAGITVTDDIRLHQLGLDIKIELSKGESLQQKTWERFVKQFQKEDSIRKKIWDERELFHNNFINYTATPYIPNGDTVKSFDLNDKELILHFGPKKK